MKYKVGYTTGVFDLFHIGHLNILRSAKAQCEYLIVGVTTDDLAVYKGKSSVIPFEERFEIVKSIKYVDEVVSQSSLDKVAAHSLFNFDVVFVGDDWRGTAQWIKYEVELKKRGVDVVYFPYTKTTSSTLIRDIITRMGRENG